MAGAQLELSLGTSAWRPALAISVGSGSVSSIEATYLRIPSGQPSASVYWGVDAGVVRDEGESDRFAGARVGAELFNQPGGALRIELHLHLFEEFARLAVAAGVRL